MGVLYCFGGGAARRVGIQVNLKSLAAPPLKNFPNNKNPASYAGYRWVNSFNCIYFLFAQVVAPDIQLHCTVNIVLV